MTNQRGMPAGSLSRCEGIKVRCETTSETKQHPSGRDKQSAFTIAGVSMAAGSRRTVEIPVTLLYTHTPVGITAQVIHGRFPGPRLFVCAALHGDELNGVEIIRRLLTLPLLNRLNGTLVAIPIVNVLGFLNRSRYLPDRRDLNRSFPGTPKGSLASQIAHLFLQEVVVRCTHGIDIHTGAIHRSNFPHTRAFVQDRVVGDMAEAFGLPVHLKTQLQPGTLRHAAAERGVPVLLYEAGEALRFDEVSVQAGVKGVINVLHLLGMVPRAHRSLSKPPTTAIQYTASSSAWLRAPESGVFRSRCRLGQHVRPGAILGYITNPLGDNETQVVVKREGIVIGQNNLPVVNQGEGVFHIAHLPQAEEVSEAVEIFHEELEDTGNWLGHR